MFKSQPSPDSSQIEQIAKLQARNTELEQELSELKKKLSHSINSPVEKTLSLVNAILEASADGILAFNEQGHITHFNQRFIELWNAPEAIISSRDDWQLLPFMQEQLIDAEVFLNQVRKEYIQSNLEWHNYLQLKDGRSFERYSKPQLLGQKIIGRVVSYRDITLSRQMEIALKQSEERFRVALYNSPIVVFNQDTQLRYTWVYNPSLGTNVESVLGKSDEELLPHEYAQHLTAIKQNVLVTGIGTRAEVSIPGLKEIQFFDLTVEPLRNESNEIIGITCAATDITERKQVETALRQSQELLQAVINAAPMRIYMKDLQGRYLMYNHFCESMTNLPLDQVLGKTDHDLFSPERAQQYRAMDQVALEAGKPITREISVSESGELHTYITTKFPVFDAEQRPYGVCGISTDISDRKRTEDQLSASLQEKEILLKEIHHRVKNNLQVVSSLLDLQAQHAQEPQIAAMFQESQNRIRSMAMIHEKLYQNDPISSIDFADYIQSLATYLVQAYAINPSKITLYFDLEPVAFSLDTAIPCGLVLNELIANGLKHAFPADTGGMIWVYLRSWQTNNIAQEHDQIELTVGNDGVKLSEIPDFAKATSLGLQLVHALTQQLQGHIWVEQHRGVEFKLQFPKLVS